MITRTESPTSGTPFSLINYYDNNTIIFIKKDLLLLNRQQTTEYKEKITEFQTLQASTSSSADADAQEKFALLDELEGLTMEKEEALSRLEDEKREKEDERREREMAALERDEAIRRLAEERRERGLARARLEDIDHLSSLEDEVWTSFLFYILLFLFFYLLFIN